MKIIKFWSTEMILYWKLFEAKLNRTTHYGSQILYTGEIAYIKIAREHIIFRFKRFRYKRWQLFI